MQVGAIDPPERNAKTGGNLNGGCVAVLLWRGSDAQYLV